MKKAIKYLVIIAVIAVAAFGIIRMNKESNSSYTEEIARTQDISAYYTFSGNLSAKSSKTVTATAKTNVKEILFSEGDTVKKNDIIVRLTNGNTLRSPMDGTISNLNIEEGDEITIGQAVFRVADYDHPEIIFMVDEYDRPALTVGQEVDVTILSTGKTFIGTVAKIAQEATVSGDMAYYEVKLTLEPDADLVMGLSCEIRVLSKSVQNVTTLPVDAIQYDSDGKPFVYCYNRSNEVIKQDVTLGISNGTIIEIVSGIRSGETVLVPAKNSFSPLSGI